MFGSGVICPNAGPVSGWRCVASLCCSPELEPRLSQGLLPIGGARQLHVVALLRLEEGGAAPSSPKRSRAGGSASRTLVSFASLSAASSEE